MQETFHAMCQRAQKYYPEQLMKTSDTMCHFESVNLNTLNIMINTLEGTEVVMVSNNTTRRIYTKHPELFEHLATEEIRFVKTTRPLNNLIRGFEPEIYKQKDIELKSLRYEASLQKEALKEDRRQMAIKNRQKRQDNYNKHNKKQGD